MTLPLSAAWPPRPRARTLPGPRRPAAVGSLLGLLGLLLGLLLGGCDPAPGPAPSPPADLARPPAASAMLARPEPGPPPPAPGPSPAALPAAAPGAAPGATSSPADGRIRFTDVTRQSGVDFVHHSGKSGQKYYVEPHSGGAALFDYDGDRHLDLYFVDGGPLPGSPARRREGNKLFRGRGDGTFVDVTAAAGVAGTAYGMGAYTADHDGDGDVDLFVTQFDAPNLLYRNEGNGRFTEVAARAGLTTRGWHTGAVWFDADRDDDLDLFVVRYVGFRPANHRACFYKGHRYHCSPYDYESEPDFFFRNQGNGRFVDETKKVGMFGLDDKGLGALAADFDGDGWQDVYVANDETPNLLYHNKKDGTFAEVGLLAGVAVNAAGATQAGMGLDAADVDGDGLQDLACCNFQNEPNNLYMNKGNNRFADEAGPRGWDHVSRDLLCFTVLLADFEQDGDMDAFITCGHVWDNVADITPGVSYPQPKLLLVNDGRGYFREESASAGEALTRLEVSRAAVIGDLDEDGDEDLAYLNIDGPAVILRNDSDRTGNHWVGVELVGRGRNREGIGARVTVEAGGRRWVREVRRNRGFFSSSPARVTFGLGPVDRLDRVRVLWPGGGEETVVEVAGPADRLVTVTQPPR